jgi:hypothetical protein
VTFKSNESPFIHNITRHICRHFFKPWFGFHLNYNFHRITLLCLTYNTLFYTKYQQVKDIKHIVVTFTSFYSILPPLLLYMYSELQYSKWASEKKAERIYFLTVNVLVFLNERRMLQMVYKVLDSFIPNCKFSMRKTYTCRCVTVLLWLCVAASIYSFMFSRQWLFPSQWMFVTV